MSAASARPLQDEPVLLTAEGYERLAAELEQLRGAGRAELLERVREARSGGDVADEVAIYDALNEQVQLERRITELEELLAAAQIAQPSTDGKAGIGNRVRLRDSSGEEFEVALVSAVEADPAEGRISIESPVGRALLGKEAGAVVTVVAPRGTLTYEVLEVSPSGGGR
jgi:transcription elongation factor GreA